MKRNTVFALAALCASVAQAQTVTYTPVTRHTGAGTGMVLSSHQAASGVEAAVRPGLTGRLAEAGAAEPSGPARRSSSRCRRAIPPQVSLSGCFRKSKRWRD